MSRVTSLAGSASRVRLALRPVELLALVVFAFALPSGLALTALSPAAWPIPAVALVGLAVMVLTGVRRARTMADAVAAEASAGTAQLEEWLRQRDLT